jgi:hypothetical protein
LLLQHDEKLAEKGKTCWQHCIKKYWMILLVQTIHFENNLKKYFENIVFRDLESIKEKGNGKLSFYSQLHDNFTKFKQT